MCRFVTVREFVDAGSKGLEILVRPGTKRQRRLVIGFTIKPAWIVGVIQDLKENKKRRYSPKGKAGAKNGLPFSTRILRPARPSISGYGKVADGLMVMIFHWSGGCSRNHTSPLPTMAPVEFPKRHWAVWCRMASRTGSVKMSLKFVRNSFF